MKPIRGILPVLAVLAGCTSEREFVSLVPKIAVEPDALDFGEVVAGEATATLPVLVANTGQALLRADLSFEGEGASAFSIDPARTHLEIPPDGSAEVPVTFAPAEIEPYEGHLVFSSNDLEQSLYPVALSGIGRVPYAPDIEI